MCAEEGGRGCRVHHRTTRASFLSGVWWPCGVRAVTVQLDLLLFVCRTPAVPHYRTHDRTSGREPGALLSLRLNYHESSNHADIRTLVIADGVG